MTTKQIASLVLDETIYPRHTVSIANVSSIAEAIMAGATVPPILVSRSSNASLNNRVVDGFHRVRAFERLYGADYEIEVVFKRYRDKRGMLADAISANVGRGQDLSRWDSMRCVELAEEVGMTIDTLAQLLQWQPERLQAYRESKTGTTIDQRKVMLKRSLRHRVGKPLTKAQEVVNEQSSGMPALFHINQIVALLETDLMPESEQIAVRLQHLCELVQVWLAEKGADG